MLCCFSVDDASPIEILEAVPSGRSMRLLVRCDGVLARIALSELPAQLRDTVSGEPILDPLRHVLLQWGRRVCQARGGWPLHQLIAALLIEGFGVTTAADLALAMGTWDRFVTAIEQLCEADIPQSREGFVLAHNARGRPVGVFEAGPDALDHAAGLYPEPLATLLDACGPRVWRGLKSWAVSNERVADVAMLLGIGSPLPFAKEDYDVFLRERFAGVP